MKLFKICECDDCFENDTPCHMDCLDDEMNCFCQSPFGDGIACEGCREAYAAANEAQFDIDCAKGLK